MTYSVPENHFARRLAILLIGLSILAFGIAMSKKAMLGTAPISCIPATLTDCFPDLGLTLGEWTIVFNVILVLLQILILRKDFKAIQILQIALAVFLGKMVDLSTDYLLFFMEAHSYLEQWIYCIISAAVLAFGVMMEIRAKLLVVPGDGLVMALAAKVRGYSFSRLKVCTDVTMVVTACVISLAAMGTLTGAREGSVFAAVAVGNFIGFYRAKFGHYIDRFLGDEKKNA
jgi:uncharacterized protein